MSAAGELELLELWPTLFLSQPIPDHEPHTARLLALAAERPGAGVFTIDDASIEWLKAHVAHGVNGYLRECGAGGGPGWGARGRFEILRRGEYLSAKARPDASLCGVYVLRVVEGYDATGRRDDLRPGALSFFDPRPAMNMNAINDDPYQRYQQTLTPAPGLLVLWPAGIRCFAHPNLGREPLARIAFDVIVAPAEAVAPEAS